MRLSRKAQDQLTNITIILYYTTGKYYAKLLYKNTLQQHHKCRFIK